MEEYLCATCLEAVRARISNKVPMYSSGPYLYIPFPAEIPIETIVEYLQWEFALDHLAFQWSMAKYPILPGNPALIVKSPLLIIRPFRRTGVEHFFFKAPPVLPPWTVVEGEESICVIASPPQSNRLPKTPYLLQNSEPNLLPVSPQATP
jgi:hypothetical protein